MTDESIPPSAFRRERPTTPGHYLWKLPEAEKPGYYVLRVELVDRGDHLCIVTDDGDEIGPVEQTSDDTFWCGPGRDIFSPIDEL